MSSAVSASAGTSSLVVLAVIAVGVAAPGEQET
jgi:hypothetical protein